MSNLLFPPVNSPSDDTLLNYFSPYGSSFPYNAGASDITISVNTTWNDSVGYKKVKKLTINAGITLTINRSPFFIFADEVNFGDTTSIIDASGGVGGSSNMAKGGVASINSKGGDGGGMLFIIATKITGANGVIKANGGNAYTINTSSSASGAGGQGALSATLASTIGIYSEFWDGSLPTTGNAKQYMHPLGIMLGSGGGGGTGGGSGACSSNNPPFGYGGSGIGGGGGTNNGSNYAGSPAKTTISPTMLIQLAFASCLGGGGGGASVYTNGNSAFAGGGGGGAIIVFAKTYTATPTVQANGGTGSWGGVVTAGINGGAGLTWLMTL